MEISVELVGRLLAQQFPQWAELPLSPVVPQGHDNRTFRLGDDLSVRLPSGEGYVAAIAKEDRHLPRLASHLTVAIPLPVATGRPTAEFPFPWSIRAWMRGEPPHQAAHLHRDDFARELGEVLRQLRGVPADDGPLAGLHSFYRGCHPSVYGDQVQAALDKLGQRVDGAACRSVWTEAVRSAWAEPPVWFHGDVARDNLLTTDGHLSAVIDFGTCGVGDPACDLVIAWTFLRSEERRIFREAVDLPADAWARARGWALWKALVTLTDSTSPQYAVQSHALAQLLDTWPAP